jgi:putative spermidine/putrescine transport system ATP-binding protein
MIRFEGVQRHFGQVTALTGFDLEIQKGELIALLGPSGCGKTTALRILGGFDRPDAGRVIVNDRDISHVPPNKRDMGMVFQAYSLFPNMDVRTNVAFGLRMRHQDKAKRLKRADELLELVGLDQAADRYPHQLSGGQQQRVAIARALAIEPTVLLLDEPLSALDARVRTQLRAEIRGLQQRLGITTLFVTHDQSEALSVADRVGVMQSGRLEQLGTPEEVYRNPATPFVAEFVGAMNRLPGRLGDNDEVQVLGQRVKALNVNGQQSGAAVSALVRPEAVAAVPDPGGAGEVTDRTFLGSAIRLVITLDTGQKVLAEASSHAAGVTVGDRVDVRLLVDSVLVEETAAPPA